MKSSDHSHFFYSIQIILIILSCSSPTLAQDGLQGGAQTRRHEKQGMYRLSLGIDHEHLNKEFEHNEYKIWAPSYAVDFSYWISDKVAAGINADMILETSELNDEHKKEYPVSLVPVVYYEPLPKFSLLAGCGLEIGDDHVKLLRVGAEYEASLGARYFAGASCACMILKLNITTVTLSGFSSEDILGNQAIISWFS